MATRRCPCSARGTPWEAEGGEERSAVRGCLPRGGTDSTHRPARLQRRGEGTAGPVPQGSQGHQGDTGRLVASPT